ncbi:MAG: S1/P1 nuclease [Myxococcota bacterium]
MLCLALPLSAWNTAGHEIVAQIALNQFSGADQKKIAAKMGDIVAIAAQPDNDRAVSTVLSKWHYIDYPWVEEPVASQLKLVSKNDNIVWALKEAKRALGKKKSQNSALSEIFKANLVHLVGDIHQPLHCISRVTIKNPKGDKGGNLFEVRFGKKKETLHHLWDGGLGLLENLSSEQILPLAREIEREFPINKQKLEGAFEDWSKESFYLAKSKAYSTPEGVLVSDTYLKEGRFVVKERLAVAGYRLAHILKELVL